MPSGSFLRSLGRSKDLRFWYQLLQIGWERGCGDEPGMGRNHCLYVYILIAMLFSLFCSFIDCTLRAFLERCVVKLLIFGVRD